MVVRWFGLLLGAALASAPASAEPVRLRVGYDVIPLHLAPVVFKMPEVMRHYGKSYTVEFVKFRGSLFQRQALVAKELDIAVLAFSSFAAGIVGAHLPLRGIADAAQDGPGFSTVYAVLDESPIRTVADLKGKVVAVHGFEGAVDLAARIVLRRHGLTPGVDVRFVEAPFPAMEAMVREKKTDLGSFVAPFWAVAEQRGGLRKLFEQKDGFGTTQFLMFAVLTETIEKRRAVLVQFLEDYLRGLRAAMAQENRGKVTRIIAGLTNQPESAIAGWALMEGRDHRHDPQARIDVEALQHSIDQLQALGVLKSRFDVRGHLDLSLVAEAAQAIP